MSLADLCDVAYVMQVQAIERQLVPLAVSLAEHGVDDALGTVERAVEQFDEVLHATGTSTDDWLTRIGVSV